MDIFTGKAIWIVCVVSLSFSACVTDEANRYYSNERYSVVSPNQVQILKGKPSKPFEVIADFQSRGDSVNSIRRKAARIGADAVIITNMGGIYSLDHDWASEDSYKGTHSHIIGTAIKYK